MYKIKLYSKFFGESLVIQDEDGSITHQPCLYPQIEVQASGIKSAIVMKYQHLEKIVFFKTAKEAKAVAKDIIKVEREKANTEVIHHFEVIKCERV